MRLRPDLAEAYRGQVVALEAACAGDPAGRAAAAEILRALIGKIVVTPLERRGQVGLELHGEFATILTFTQGSEQSGRGFVVSMVAGEGLEPPTRVQAMPKLVVQCRERARSISSPRRSPRRARLQCS